MTDLAFAAVVIAGAGVSKPFPAPERVENPRAAVLVRNPYTGHLLWLRSRDVVNVVNGVAAVQIEAAPSGRFPDGPPKRGFREFINPLTGNTFQVELRATIKESSK